MVSNEMELFTEMTAEESAEVNGGASTVAFDWDGFFFRLGAGAVLNAVTPGGINLFQYNTDAATASVFVRFLG